MHPNVQPDITQVRVEGLVLCKIIKHCHEQSFLEPNVIGSLMGLAKGSILQVTNSFPLPSHSSDEATACEQINSYELEMCKNLRTINSDYFSVGCYSSAIGDSFITRSNLEHMYLHEQNSPESVMLVFDPSLVVHGQWGLKAYKLAPDVSRDMANSDQKSRLNQAGNSKASQEFVWECDAAASEGRTNYTRLLQEIPVEIHNSPMASLLLHDIQNSYKIPAARFSADLSSMLPTLSSASTASENSDLNAAASMEQQLRSLLNGLEMLHDYQYNYHRKLASIGKSSTQEMRNRDLPPIKLDMALLSAQLNSYCTGLSQMAGETVGKLMLTQAIHSSQLLE